VRVSGERAGCLLRVLLGRGIACENCGSVGFFVIKDTRWSTTSPPELEVTPNCANCGTGATIPFSLQEARRCGLDNPE
jgi:hypothetical protein